MKKLIPFLSLLVLLSACNNSYKIEGSSSISSLDGKTLLIKTLKNNEWSTVDSTEVLHGHFKMQGDVDSVRIVTLFMNGESLMPLVLEQGNIDISISNTELKVSGTPLNDKLYDFFKKRGEMEEKLGELERKEAQMVMDGGDLGEIHVQLQKEGESLSREMNDYIKDFISSNYDNVLGPNVFMMLCSGLPYPIMTPQLEELVKGAPDSFKNHTDVKNFIRQARENEKQLEEHQRMEQNSQQQMPK